MVSLYYARIVYDIRSTSVEQFELKSKNKSSNIHHYVGNGTVSFYLISIEYHATAFLHLHQAVQGVTQ